MQGREETGTLDLDMPPLSPLSSQVTTSCAANGIFLGDTGKRVWRLGELAEIKDARFLVPPCIALWFCRPRGTLCGRHVITFQRQSGVGIGSMPEHLRGLCQPLLHDG